jgi:hypothetical protein
MSNELFLAASLEWLRLRLRLHAGENISGYQIESAEAEIAPHVPTSALHELARRLELSQFERDTLLLCAAMELDPAMASLCARAQGDAALAYPTFGLALAALPYAAWEAISPQGGLRYWRLVEVTQPSGRPLIAAALRADERIVNYIKGLNHLDDRLEPMAGRLENAPGALAPSQALSAQSAATALRNGVPVQLTGADREAQRLVAAQAAGLCGLIGYKMDGDFLPSDQTSLDSFARLWRREARLLPVAMLLDATDCESTIPIGRFAARCDAPLVIGTRDGWPGLNEIAATVTVKPPTLAERHQAWLDTLGEPATAEELAAGFVLNLPAIEKLAASKPQSLRQECLARTRPHLDALAQRVTPSVDWSDLVLPPFESRQLWQIADHVAGRTTVYQTWGFGQRITRGLGVSALFVGASGTGKTMAAEVLAGHLDLDLYRIDLSAVVNKYIGETEKNLRRLFDAADRGGAILFFDEADAIFGKRSEVKDAHDRYANIEINYLLQRMENYDGLAILATNQRSALDTAFLRRIRFIVTFPSPGQTERRAMWAQAFPIQAPRESLDLDRLATLPVTGGMIRNVALNAAFAAAAAKTSISMPLVLTAARAEFRKADIPVREKDFVL